MRSILKKNNSSVISALFFCFAFLTHIYVYPKGHVPDFTIPNAVHVLKPLYWIECNWGLLHPEYLCQAVNVQQQFNTSEYDTAYGECSQENANVQSSFWQKLWFEPILFIIIAILLFFAYKLRVSQIIKEKYILEKRVSECTAQSEAANKELQSFLYSVSHDLRAPLRHLDGFSQALLEDFPDQLDDKSADYLERIRKASQKMGQLINDLLSLSRLLHSEMSFENFDLSEQVRILANEYQKKYPDLKIIFDITPSIQVNGDRSCLISMMRNLIDNACKYSRDRDNTIIEFGMKIIDDKPVYFLKDNGLGFRMAFAEKIFEPFQRYHADFDGTGIGLAIVKRVIARHGGHIWTESTENEGSTFFFTLGNIH